jgi:kumamolisin
MTLISSWMPLRERGFLLCSAGGNGAGRWQCGAERWVAWAILLVALLHPAISRAQLSPSNLLSAYGFNTVQQTYTGAGETVAIYSESYYSGLQADVNQFSNTYMGGVSTTLKVTTGTGGTPPGTDTPSTELALDVEYAHLLAPGATIMVIAGPNSETATNYAATHGACDFSTSYSSYESGFTQSQVQSDDASYATAVSKGLAIFAAAGDSSHVDYPASSPYVIGVAATNLTVTGNGAYSSETAWSTGGGGQSTLETEPAYQDAVQGSGYRMTPDVSLAGGNLSEMPVILQGATEMADGSSFASPIWAGYMALVDQARGAMGPLSSTQLLYALYGSQQNGNYSSIFHDITTGNNPTSGLSAGTGYDELTGLGSPQAVPMLDYLETVPEPVGLSFLLLISAMMVRPRRSNV